MNPWRSLGALPRPVWILCITSLINRAGTMLLPFLALYATHPLHMSPPEAGTLLLVYRVGAIVAAQLGGWLCDRIGAIRLIRITLFGSGLIQLAFVLVDSYAAAAVAVVVLALFAEAYRPALLVALSVA